MEAVILITHVGRFDQKTVIHTDPNPYDNELYNIAFVNSER